MYNFDVKKATESCVEWIREWFDKNGRGCNAVIGISGGKDSSVVAALCVKALGKDRVIGVMMPNGVQADISDSEQLIAHLGIKSFTVNIEPAFKGILAQIEGYSEQTKINLPARLRMSTLYAISQTNNGRVINTCNLSEDYVGWSTRYGDSVADMAPISNFTVTEVKLIGEYLGLPDKLVHKAPSDGLCGSTDEEKLGFMYSELDDYIRKGIEPARKARIDSLHEKNLFKLRYMDVFHPDEDTFYN